MALFFFIEVSPGGAGGAFPSVEDSAFTLLAGPLPDSGAGFLLPHLTTDAPPVIGGRIYAYRARRFDDVTGLYSDYSPLAFARAPEPWRNFTMDGILDDVITGAKSELWIGLESYEGFIVKAQKRLNYRSGGGDVNLETLFSQKLENNPSIRSQPVAGMGTVTLNFLVEATPEGGFPLLLKITLPDTVSGGSSPYTHQLANKFGAKSATVYHREGNYLFVYGGCRVSSLSFDNLSAEATDIVTCPITMMTKSVTVFDLAATPGWYAAFGLDTAGADTLGPYSASSDAISTIGSEIGTLRSATVGISKNLGTKRTMRGKRGPAAHYEQKTDITGTADVFFDNLQAILRQYGQPADLDTTKGFGPTCNVLPIPCSIALVPCNNPSGFSNSLVFTWESAIVQTATQPVGDDGAITQSLTLQSLKAAGNVVSTDFYLEQVNSISDTTLSTAGAAVPDWPVSKMDTYFSAVAASGTTTTVVATAGNAASLSATDNDRIYLAKSILFLSGALKGISRRISAYNATTRTFTTAAFGSAPTAGDIFTVA